MSIRLTNCDLVFDNSFLLSKVSMSVQGGEVVSVIGANGSGKTSLIKVLTGDYSPTHGEVYLDERPLSGFDLEARARSLAVLPQRSMLDFPFLVTEVIEMGRFPKMTGRLYDQKIVAEIVDHLSLEEFVTRRYTTLSGGERQRVQIARILAQLWDTQDKAHLLFDEPTAPLDLSHQLDFFSMVRSLADNGAAILLAIHDINLAARFSDRLILLKQGRILAEGLPEEVITNENIELAFNVKVNIMTSNSNQAVQISY